MNHWKYYFFATSIFLGSLQASWTSSPFTIDSGSSSSMAPLVVDADGNVTAAWLENYDNIGDDPQAAFFSMSSKEWKSPQPIIVAGAGLSTPQLIVDAFGTVTQVWIEYYSEHANSYTLFATRSTKGGSWTTPVPLNSLPSYIHTNAQAPISMVADAQGNVTLAWLEQDLNTNNYAVGTARFTSDINISPTLYPFLNGSSPNANNSICPQLVIDQLGYVTVVWQEWTDSGFALQAARLDPSGSGWSSPVTINGSSPNAYSLITPLMVVDTSGVVTVVWQEITDSQYAVQAARFNPGIGGVGGSWTLYTDLAPALTNACESLSPKIIVDSSDSVTLVAVDVNYSIWTSSFATGSSSWTFPSSPLNSGTAFSLTRLEMVVDDTGIVTILWINDNAGSLVVQATRGFEASWDPAASLNAGNADGNTPLLVVIDTSGTVTASWMEGFSMQASRFVSEGSSWTEAATLNGGNLYNQIEPKMVVGPSGAVNVVWQEGPSLSSTYAIQAARFMPGETHWSDPITLDNGSQDPNAYHSSMTQQINMVVDAFDNVTVTWLESRNSSLAIQSARFTAPHIDCPMPPTHLRGYQIINNKDVVNILTWDPPIAPLQCSPVIAYRIYQGIHKKKLVGTVSTSVPLIFEQHYCKMGKRYVYSIVSVDSTGKESRPVYVKIGGI